MGSLEEALLSHGDLNTRKGSGFFFFFSSSVFFPPGLASFSLGQAVRLRFISSFTMTIITRTSLLLQHFNKQHKRLS